MKRMLLFVTLMLSLRAVAQDRKMSITIDDLPCANCAEGTWSTVTMELLAILDKHAASAVGFVNEGMLYREDLLDTARLHLLSHWLERGHELGNHTFGHTSANVVSVADFERDLLRGQELTAPLAHGYHRALRYFRHPFLHAGATPGRRDSLNAMLQHNGYTIAPVTLDNDEYIYAHCYEHAKRDGDTTAMQDIATEYLEHMDDVVRFYEERSMELLGRPMAHSLLIHANTLNAEHLGELLTRLMNRGYRYITLDETLKDEAYSLPAATTRYGFSWIRRWQEAAGQQPPWPPEASRAIMARYEALQKSR